MAGFSIHKQEMELFQFGLLSKNGKFEKMLNFYETIANIVMIFAHIYPHLWVQTTFKSIFSVFFVFCLGICMYVCIYLQSLKYKYFYKWENGRIKISHANYIDE